MNHRTNLFLTLVLALIPALAEAQSFAPSAERGVALLAGLELRIVQRKASNKLLATARKQAIRMRADIEIAGIDLRTELDKNDPDEKFVGTLIETMSSLEGQLRKSRIVTWIQIRRLLSYKQRRQLKRLRNEGGRNIVKTQGEFINPFDDYDSVARRGLEQSRLRDPFESARGRSKKAKRKDRSAVNITTAKAAKIFVDGRQIGVSPLSVRLRPGKHRVRSVFLDGSAPVIRSINVKPDTNMMIQLD